MRGCGRRHATSASGKARYCRVAHQTPRDGLRREMEHTGQRTPGPRPSTELSERTTDRVRRRRLPASAHNPATTPSASDDQQLRPAAPTSTSTIQPPHTSPLTSQFRLERPQSIRMANSKAQRNRRYARIATDWSQIARYILLSSPPPRIAKDRWATEAASASSARAIRDVRVAAHQARAGVAEPLLTTARRCSRRARMWRGSA